MRKSAFVLVLLLLPSVLMAQGTVTIQSVSGKVDWKPVNAAQFSPLSASTQLVHVGDQIRTGVGANLYLALPDTSYLVISENSTVTIQDFWAADTRNLVDVLVGRVRFYIQKIGGKPNPYRVQTPTALIAVRGTTFDVISYDGRQTEVACLEGRVAVETRGLPDREVILEPGKKTMVIPGVPPIVPVALEDSLMKNRVIHVARQDEIDSILNGRSAPSIDRRGRDNDRMNRTGDPLQGVGSTTTTDVQRTKPGTLRFPPQ